jgi:hypothetical protein
MTNGTVRDALAKITAGLAKPEPQPKPTPVLLTTPPLDWEAISGIVATICDKFMERMDARFAALPRPVANFRPPAVNVPPVDTKPLEAVCERFESLCERFAARKFSEQVTIPAGLMQPVADALREGLEAVAESHKEMAAALEMMAESQKAVAEAMMKPARIKHADGRESMLTRG